MTRSCCCSRRRSPEYEQRGRRRSPSYERGRSVFLLFTPEFLLMVISTGRGLFTLLQHAYVHASCMPASSMRSLLIAVLAAPGAVAQAVEHQVCHQN